MHYNEGYPSDIVGLSPMGTNSTFFTNCCNVAICDNQANCPSCGRHVVGWNEEIPGKRNKIRWQNATRFWKRKQ